MDKLPQARTGDFCWLECAALDPQAAKEFYSSLFGWTYEEGNDPAMPYTTLMAGEIPIGGLYALMDEQKQEGIPPNWTSYIQVDKLEPMLAKVGEHGGHIHLDPCEVPNHGRLAVIQDPTGATVAMWEPGEHAGCAYGNGDGMPTWFELMTTNLDEAVRFFGAVFGWTTEDHPVVPDGSYKILMNDGQPVGGAMQMGEEFAGIPSHWMPYFQVADPDAIAGKVEQGGGVVRVPPMDIEGVGRFAVASAPDGAVFSIIRLAPQPV